MGNTTTAASVFLNMLGILQPKQPRVTRIVDSFVHLVGFGTKIKRLKEGCEPKE